MSSRRRKGAYPSRMSGVYLSSIIAVWSVILALLLLQNVPLLAYYVLTTVIITASVFVLKMRLYTRPKLAEAPPDEEQILVKSEKRRGSWKMLLLVFCMLLTALFVPLFLAWVLPSEAWFVLIISFTSGVSIAEVLLYLYMR
jgi:hypothetical protein